MLGSSEAVADAGIRELGAADEAKWNAFLSQHPDSNLYHTLEWRDFVVEVFGHKPFYLFAEKGADISGILPMFLVSMPLLGTKLGSKLISLPYDIGSGGGLTHDAATETALVRRAIALAHEVGAGYLQLRYSAPRPQLGALELELSQPVVLSELELKDEKTVWSNVSRNHWRSLRKAESLGVRVSEAETWEEFRQVEQIILEVFRDFGTPPYGPRYFKSLWRRMHPTGQLRALLAHIGSRCVGGQLNFCSGKTLVCKLSLCLPEAAAQGVNVALFKRCIEMAFHLGYRKVSWGTSSHDQKGLIEFKDKWGSKSQPVGIYSQAIKGTVPDLGKYYNSTGIERRIWRKLPLGLTRMGGAVLSRWFC